MNPEDDKLWKKIKNIEAALQSLFTHINMRKSNEATHAVLLMQSQLLELKNILHHEVAL